MPITDDWLSRDPIGEWGGENLNAFVLNGPLNSVDYLGFVTFVDTWSVAHGHLLRYVPNIYEIAKIETELEADTKNCMQHAIGCCGLVENKLTVTIYAPNAAQMTRLTPMYQMSDSESGNTSENFKEDPSKKGLGYGHAYTASLKLSPVHCSGGRAKGKATIQLPSGGGGKATINYDVNITHCGNASGNVTITADSVAGDRDDFGNPIVRPPRQTGSSHGAGPFQPPYPPSPGTPLSPM